jgi:hypothetical protein
LFWLPNRALARLCILAGRRPSSLYNYNNSSTFTFNRDCRHLDGETLGISSILR